MVAFVCIYLVWGSTFYAIRVGLEHLPPLFLCAIRLLAAGAMLALAAWRLRAPWPRGIEWRDAALVGLLLPAIGNGSVTLGETHVPSGLVALLVASIPMFTALFAALGPERTPLRPRVIAGLVVGFAGIALLVGDGGFTRAGGTNIVWALIPVLGSMSWSWGTLWSRRAAMPRSPLTSTAVGMSVGGAALLIASLVAGEWPRLTPASFGLAPMGAVLYLAVFGSVVGFTAYLWLTRHVPPTRVSTYAFVNPVVAMTIGTLLAGEPFGGRVAVAAGLVVVAVALIVTTPVPARVVSAGAAEPAARPATLPAADPAA